MKKSESNDKVKKGGSVFGAASRGTPGNKVTREIITEKVHWADHIAKQLLQNGKMKQVIVTGTSLSGEPHIGNANDMIRGDAIRKAVVDAGGKAELAWIADDMDPYRSVPAGFPAELKKYLGHPVGNIPDPWKCHKNFALHFEEMLLGQLKELGVKPKAFFGVEMYRKGMYNDSIKTAMKKRNEIIAILNRFREKPLEENWQPINIICENCGKMVTTKMTRYDHKTAIAEYACSPEEVVLHKEHRINGCGHKGKISVLNGNAKLTWRVEWAARWAFLKATCEPFGKEHAAAGGSYDTGKEIVKLFGGEPPLPVVYEFFQMAGAKMSKSKGNVVTVPIMLEVLRPQEIKFWMYYGKISKARNIDLSEMPIHITEEFDKAERIYFGEKTDNPKEDENYKRAYELASLGVPKQLVQAPYTFCSAIVQVAKGRETETLQKTGHLPKDLTAVERREVEARLQNCRKWLANYAPEQYRVQILEKMPKIELGKELKDLFSDVAEKLGGGANGDELQQFFYDEAKRKGIQPPEAFAAAYQLLLGKERGPRLGPFLVSLEKGFVVKRLKLKG